MKDHSVRGSPGSGRAKCLSKIATQDGNFGMAQYEPYQCDLEHDEWSTISDPLSPPFTAYPFGLSKIAESSENPWP
jgi:hypothetical protein